MAKMFIAGESCDWIKGETYEVGNPAPGAIRQAVCQQSDTYHGGGLGPEN